MNIRLMLAGPLINNASLSAPGKARETENE
jgi:hypothetical protein